MDLFARASTPGALWTAPPDSGAPSGGRWGMAYGFDTARKKLVVFGGWTAGNGAAHVVQEYEPVAQTWVYWSSNVDDRYGAAAAYDDERQRFVLYSGRKSPTGAAHEDTWERDTGGFYVVLPLGSGPPPLFFASMVYDAARHRMVLYGGASDSGAEDAAYSYSVIATACASNDECGTGHCVDRVCCADAECTPGSACNLPKNPGFCAEDGP